MDRQLKNILSSGLRENWVTMFCDALAKIAASDYQTYLRQVGPHDRLDSLHRDGVGR
jgi:hypothetical protein